MPDQNPERLNGPKRMLDRNPNDPAQGDFVKHGGAYHMGILGIRECERDEKPAFVAVGKSGKRYCFTDPTMYLQYGPLAHNEFIQEILNGKVRELENAPKVPKDAPKLWMPTRSDGTFDLTKSVRAMINDDGVVVELPE